MQLFIDLNAALIANLGPLGPLYAVGGLGLLLILAMLPLMMRKSPDPLEKLRQSNLNAQAAARAKEPARKMLRSGKTDKLEKFAGFLEPQNEEEMTSARLKLTRAGYRGKSAVRTFHAAQFVLGIGLLILGVIYTLIKSQNGQMSSTYMILYTLGPAVAGYYLPRYWVDKRVESRQKEMQNGFPDALDMLLVCVEAGQSVDQAIIRVAKELEAGFPALAEEFEMVAYEVKAGKEKATVLRGFAERAGLPDISSFVTVMIQSQTFGTSIADALRVYAADMRDKRVMRAEELANKLPTKITLGTMMFTVPPLLIILVGPSIHSMLGLFESMR
ncbi:type II secretion system F family protein [Frigidibacter sp.]|uniref:type II secretion system F family protein n=1 Tax=Frigidibacter sp. TaxID=2586418 RepID=UPI002733A5AD|nr:type II secretion system F family protein [Frigidibacter sp.]MDP3338810.1 type II secretion system F family protein [Frigidibacter sp.]